MIVNKKYLFFFISIFALTFFCSSANVDAKEKKAWHVSYTGTLTYDDNVILLPDTDPLPGDISDKGSIVGKNKFLASYKFKHLFGGDLKVLGSYTRSDYEEEDIDNKFHLQTITGSLKYKHPSPIGKLGVGFSYNHNFLVRKKYLKLVKFDLSDQINFKHGFSIISFRIDYSMYENAPSARADRDGQKYILDGSYYHFLFNKKGYLMGGISGRIVDTDGNNYDLKGLNLKAALKVPLYFGFNLTIKGRAKFDWYDNNYQQTLTTWLNKERYDDDYRIGVDLKRKLGKYLEAGFKYQHDEETSNISSFEYDKNKYTLFIKATY